MLPPNIFQKISSSYGLSLTTELAALGVLLLFVVPLFTIRTPLFYPTLVGGLTLIIIMSILHTLQRLYSFAVLRSSESTRKNDSARSTNPSEDTTAIFSLPAEINLHKSLITRAPVPIFVIDSNHRVLIWNRALEVMTALSASAVEGTDLHWTPFYSEKQPTLADLIIDSRGRPELIPLPTAPSTYAEGGIQSEGWYELSGCRRYLRFEASPVFSPEGELVAAVETFADMTAEMESKTELHRYQNELEKKHAELSALFAKVEKGKREWEVTLDQLKDLLILTDPMYIIRRYNRLLAQVADRPITDLVGLRWDDLLKEVGFEFVSFDGSQGELYHSPTGRSYDIHIYEVRNASILDGYIISLNDTTALRAATQQLEATYTELKNAQIQVYQQEKMASIGQLAAGVAHEINNPMGFVTSNLSTLGTYSRKLVSFKETVDHLLLTVGENERAEYDELKKKLKLDYIISDLPQLINESLDGAERVRLIVQTLKNFSRSNQTDYLPIDLNEALETTINIAWNEIKYVATLFKEYGEIPPLLCYPQQLNQVILNLLINSVQALQGSKDGKITIKTWADHNSAWISIADNGPGIPAEYQARVFEPFFTTKPVGQGTGLGLSISYDIIRKHGGEISLISTPETGTEFTIRLPLKGDRQGTEFS